MPYTIFDYLVDKSRKITPEFEQAQMPVYGTGEPQPPVASVAPYKRPSLFQALIAPNATQDIMRTNRAFEMAPLQARQAFNLEQEQWGPRLNNALIQRSAFADLDFSKSQQQRPVLEQQDLELRQKKAEQDQKNALALSEANTKQEQALWTSRAAQMRASGNLPQNLWNNNDEVNGLILRNNQSLTNIEEQSRAGYSMVNKNPQRQVLAQGNQFDLQSQMAQAGQRVLPFETEDKIADLREKATLRPARAKLNQFEANTGITPAQAINLGWIPTPTEQGFSFSRSPIPSPEEEMMQSLMGDPLSAAADSAGIPKLAPEISMTGQPTRRAMVAPTAAAKETTTTKEKTPPLASPPNQAPTRPAVGSVNSQTNTPVVQRLMEARRTGNKEMERYWENILNETALTQLPSVLTVPGNFPWGDSVRAWAKKNTQPPFARWFFGVE